MKLLLLISACVLQGYIFSQATLPTYCTSFSTALPTGWTKNNTGTDPTHDDCNGSALRFSAAGQILTINYNAAATTLKYSISRNNNNNKTLLVQESPNGTTWTTIATWTQANTPLNATLQTHSLNSLSRYVRFNMTVRAGGKMEIDIAQIYNGTPAAAAANCKILNLDCLNSYPLCSDQTFSGNTNDFGTQELDATNRGCLTDNEHQSSWYYFQPITSGTFEFILTPTASIDYDFAIWTGTCAALGTPVRCSFSDNYAPTGMVVGAGDNTETPAGDGYVNALSIVAGQTYIMLIDNYTADNTSFTFDITLSNGATLDCSPTPLPVQLVDFTGKENYGHNLLSWSTYSESGNDYFLLERSTDGINWETAHKQQGAGNSTALLNYEYADFDFKRNAINYYRLSQVDYNGEGELFKFISIDNTNGGKQIVRVLNLMGQELPLNATGTVILIFEDGTSEVVRR